MSKVKIRLDACGCGEVSVDGVEVQCQEIWCNFRAGKPSLVRLILPPDAVDIEVDAEATQERAGAPLNHALIDMLPFQEVSDG